MHRDRKKESFCHYEFYKYKNNIRKTWDTFNEIMNGFSSCFVHEGIDITGPKI